MKLQRVYMIEPPPPHLRPRDPMARRIVPRTVDVWTTDNAPRDYRELSSEPHPLIDRRVDVQQQLGMGHTIRVSEFYGASSRWPDD